MSVLDDAHLTLAESFSRSGYRTAAFVSNSWLIPEFGFDQGFEVYQMMPHKVSANQINQAAIAWYRSTNARRPRFLYLHYMDTHGPYVPPPAFIEKFDNRYPSQPLSPEQYDQLGYLALGPYSDDKARDLASYLKRYDAAAAFADWAISGLIQEIRAINPNTLIVFTSDHGESFFEHGFPDHGYTLHDELIRVPLFMLFPGENQPSRVIDVQVELVDIFPTLSSYLNLSQPDYPLSGRDLLPSITTSLDPNRPASSFCAIRGPMRTAARMPHLKIIRSLATDDQYIDQVYDLSQDAQELSDLSQSHRELHREAVSILHRVSDRDLNSGIQGIQPGQARIDPETMENLRSLGYVE